MVKTYTAQSVGKNHDWDFTVDEDSGQITSLKISAEVDYTGGVRRGEVLDIWSVLTNTQKAKIQSAYDNARQWFNNQFLG